MSEAFDNPIIMEIPMEIPESLYQLRDVMASAGFEMYIAGGAVRDTILGKSPKDYDIATNATPEDVIRILSPYVKRIGVQGEKSFAVARMIAYDGNEYEFAPYRVERGTRMGGEATLSTKENPLSIKDDAMRRDLTINALFYRIPTRKEREDGVAGEVVDYVGGIDDIKNEVIRTVGDPDERFGEDRLRILRAFRFAGRMGGEVDEETANAIRSNNSLTENSEAAVSDERIQDEVKKGIKTSKSPSHYINMLKDFDLFPQILPGLKVSKAISSSRNVAVQLATILQENNSSDVANVLFQKKYGNDIKDSVKFLLNLTKLNAESLIGLKRELIRMKKASKTIMSNEAIMDFGGAIGQDFNKFINFASAPPVVSARDLIAGGMKPGPEMGEAIRSAEGDAYFEKNPENTEGISEASSDITEKLIKLSLELSKLGKFSETNFLNNHIKKAHSLNGDKIENPLNIPIPPLSGEVYIFDMDDTLFWTPEWHTIVETNEEGDATSVDMDLPNMFHKAISFVQRANENHVELIKKDKKGKEIQGLADSYRQEVGNLRLIKRIVDLPMLGKDRQVVFVLSDESGSPIGIPMLKKYFSSKNLKAFDLRGKYVPEQAVVAGDAVFYQSPKTLGTIPNEEILNTYKTHSDNAVILTARETREGMAEGIMDRLTSVGLKLPISIFTKPTNISSGKYKAHIIGQIAQQDSVSSIKFYDDNLKYINDVNNILENVYGPDLHSKVTIYRVSISAKPKESLRVKASNDKVSILKKLITVANELDERGLIEEADYLDNMEII